jgi:hypothetical protein
MLRNPGEVHVQQRFATILLALLLSAAPALAQAGGRGAAGGPPRPAPRWPDGRVNFNSPPGEPGLWTGNGGRLAVNPNSYEPNTTRNAPIHINDVPLQDWARAIIDYRHSNSLADEPHTRCKPSPGPRQFVTPYGIEILDMPEMKRVFIIDLGGPHSFREIFMDGRPHPAGKDLMPSYYGHSIGRWEGDTLVIDTVGINEGSWMNRDGIPHTDRLHLVERVTRVDYNTLRYEVRIDDPGAFNAAWNSSFNLSWSAGAELFEYICQDNNLATETMTGAGPERSSPIIP